MVLSSDPLTKSPFDNVVNARTQSVWPFKVRLNVPYSVILLFVIVIVEVNEVLVVVRLLVDEVLVVVVVVKVVLFEVT
jgi:hypothetical protein